MIHLLAGTSGGAPLGSAAGIATVVTGLLLVAVLIYRLRGNPTQHSAPAPPTAPVTMDGVMPQQVPTVSASELPEDAVVLDVREDDEWVHGHIDGATHIPMGDVPSRLDELPEGDPLYITCRGGGRSARVAGWLNQNGFDAVNVGGGMGEWEAAGKPMVSETGEPPYVR